MANRRARLKPDVEAQHRPFQSVCRAQPVSRRAELVMLVVVRNVNWQRGGDLAYPSEAACDLMLS